jgi:hypothetical protein
MGSCCTNGGDGVSKLMMSKHETHWISISSLAFRNTRTLSFCSLNVLFLEPYGRFSGLSSVRVCVCVFLAEPSLVLRLCVCLCVPC